MALTGSMIDKKSAIGVTRSKLKKLSFGEIGAHEGKGPGSEASGHHLERQ